MHQITPRKLTLAIAVCGLSLFTVFGAQAAEAKGKGKNQDQAEVTNASDSKNKARGHQHNGPGKGHPDHKGKGHGHNHGGGSDDDSGSGGDDGDTPVVDTPVIDGDCAIYYAGQHIVVGSVCVSLDGDNLLVDYIMEDGWDLSEPHLWVGESLDSAPTSGNGGPIPGRFPYTASVMGVDTQTFTIPLSDLGLDAESYCADPSTLLVGAHGVVSNGGQTESAWAGETRFSKKGNWATYFGVQAACGGDDDDDDDDNGSGLPETCGITDTRSVGLPLTYSGTSLTAALTDSFDQSAAYGNLGISSLGTSGFSMTMGPNPGFDIRQVDLYVGTAYSPTAPITYSFDPRTQGSGNIAWFGSVDTIIIPTVPAPVGSQVAAFVTICAEGVSEQE